MKKNLKKKVMLAVLAGGMLCANGALAAGNYWVGTTGNVWSTELSDAKPSDMMLTLTASTKDKNGKGWDNYYVFAAGRSQGVGEVKNNSLTIENAVFDKQDSYDFYAGDGTNKGTAVALNNTLTLKNVTVKKEVQMLAGMTGGNANKNIIDISESAFDGINGSVNLYGAQSGDNAETNNNKVTLNNGVSFKNITGNIVFLGGNGKAKANYNEVNVKSTSFENVTGQIVMYAGRATTGETSNNKLIIDNGVSFGNITVKVTLFGGFGVTKANDNEVTIKGTSFQNVKEARIFIAQANATTGEVNNNTAVYDNLTFTDVGEVTMQGAYGAAKADKTTITVMNSTFGGKTIIYSSDTNDGVASNGVVTVQDSSFSGKADIYGSYAENLGTATGGKVTVKGTSFAGETNICGNKTEDFGGTASNGNVTVQDSSFTIAGSEITEIYGSFMGNDTDGGTADGSVTVKNATFDGAGKLNIYGSFSEFGDVFGSNVTVEGGQYGVETNIYGNFTKSGNISEGNVVVNGVHFSAKAYIYGSYDNNSYDEGGVTASKGCITVTDSVFDGQTAIVGSLSDAKVNAIASNGKVTITGSEFKGNDTTIYGSYAAGNATGSEVTINGAYFNGNPDSSAAGDNVNIYGGMGLASASGNKVTINDISFSGIEYCNILAGASGLDISNNAITINGGDFTSIRSLNIFVGSGDNAEMSNNTITINGGKFSSDKSKQFYIYAGDSGAETGTGNVLNINTCVDGIVEEIYYPQTINFKAPSGMDTELPMLNVRNAVALAGVNIGVDVSKISLAADDFITLIDNVDGTDYTPADGHYQVLTVDNSKYFLVYSGSTDPVTVNPDVVVNAGATPYNSGKSKGVYYDVFNGTDLTGKITGNTMTVDRGTFKNSVYGAGAAESTGTHYITNNVVNIKGGTFESDNEMNIVAGYGKSSGDATLNVGGDSPESGNQLNISGGKFIRSDSELRLIGGMANNGVDGGNVRYNILNVRGGFFEAGDEDHSIGLYGAYNPGTGACINVTYNEISFGADGGSISVAENSHIKIYGVYDSANGQGVTASNNTISIIGDTDKTSFVTITGACFSGSSMIVSAKDNVVNIGKNDGSTVFKNMKFTSVLAESHDTERVLVTTFSGNTLNVNSKISVAGDVGGFQIINFTLPAGFGESDVMLTVGGTMNFDEGEGNTTIGINALPDGFVAVKGATVTLISANDFKGNYTSGLGTLELKDKKLCLKLLDGNISAKDLTVDAQVNKGDTIILTGEGDDNVLSKTISGEGGMQIGNGSDAASVKTSAGNLAITGGVTVKAQAGLKITGGALAQNVASSGTVEMEEGSSFGTGGKITGGNVDLVTGVNFNKDNLSGVGTLNLNDAVYNFSAILGDSTITLDKIEATNISGTLSLGDISLSGDALTAGTYQASYITGTPASLTVNGISAVIYDGKTYIFSQGHITPGDSGSGEKAGAVDILVEDKAYTLKEIINGDTGGGFDPAKIVAYVMTENYTAPEGGMGTLNKATGASDRTLKVDGDGTYKLLGNSQNGITVNSGDTLTLRDIAEISGWSAYAVNSSGTVNFAGDVTLGTDAVMKGAGTYINKGTLTTSAVNLKMTNGLTNNGTLILNDGTLDVTVGGAGSIVFGTDMSVSATKLVNTGTNTVNKGKTLTITDGSLAQTVGGDGNLTIDGDVSADADNIKTTGTNKVNSGKTLTLNGDGTGDDALTVAVGGAGNLTINGDVSADADNIKTTGTNTVNSGKTLTLTGDGTGNDTLTVAVGGAGNLTINGNVTANADNIGTTGINTVNEDKTLTITGGVLTQTIGGAGSIAFDADMSVSAAKLTNTGTNTVNVGKTLTITGGALTQAIGGAGSIAFDADMSVSAAKLINTGTNTVNVGKTLTIMDGSLAQTIGGAGNLTINGDVSADADNIKTTGTNTVNVGKTLTITDGSLTQTVGGAGNLTINGDVSADADNIKTTGTNTVNSGKTLTITEGSLTANITNNGAVSMATGSSFGTGGKITGGTVKLGDDVAFTKENLDNVTITLDKAVYNVSASLDEQDGLKLEKLNVAGASGTIVLGNIVLTGENLDSWADGEYKQIQFVTATGCNTLGVTNSEIVTIGDSTYTFGQAYLTAGDSASGLKFGFLEILKEIEGGGDTRTLQEMLDQENGDVKYVLKADEVITGTLQLRDIAGSVPRTLTLKGKGNSIIADNDSSVLKNNNADTLSLENIGVKNFDTAVENKTEKGTVDLKSVTFTGTKTMDVVNDGTLNILDDKVNFAKGVSGTGTMNVKDNLTLNAGAGIEQNTINVDAGKILTNKGTITINNGSLNGDGTTALTNAGTVVIDNGNLNTKVAGGVLEFDGESSVEKAEYIAGNTNRVRSQAKLKLANEVESELKAILEGDGEVIIDSAIDATGATEGGIKTRVTINKDKSLTIYADKLGNVTTNNGTLNLKGGAGEDGRTLSYAVSGAGKTVITGGSSGAEWTVTADAPITNSGGITVDQYNVLKADVANLGCEVANNGIVKLFGGTLDNPAVVKNNINGGTVDVIGGVFDMTNIATVQNVNTLQLTDGSIMMDAEDLLDNGITPTKTAFGSKFEGKGGFLNLNNFGGADTFTAEEYKNINNVLNLNGKTTLVLSGNLKKAADETVVVQGDVNDSDGTVTLGGVKPKVVKKTTPTGGTVVAALPAEYVGVTKSDSADLVATDKIIVSGQSKFVAKGFQIDKLKDTAKGVLDLEIKGDGTELTLVGGDKETGVVNNSTQEKIPVKLAVKEKAVFNAGLAASDDKNELIFSDILIDNAKMNVVGNNIATPKLTIQGKGWLVVDPTYMKTDELEILGGAIQVVTDGAVFNQGYDVAQLKDFVERAGVRTTVKGDGFIVGNGIGIMALKNSVGHTNVTINKTAGDHLSITADPTYNPETAPMLRLDKGALLILEGSKAQDSSVPGIIDLQGSTEEDVSISNDAKVFVAGANAQGVGTYKLLHGDGVKPEGNYFGGNIYTDNTLYKIALLLPEERIEKTFGFKLTWNEANTIFSAENLGVTRGAHDVTNMVTDAVTTHFGNKEEGEKLWATFIHNKNKVDGLAIGDSQAKYDEQFNGTVIGYDLVDDQDITLGLALGYVDGNTTNGIGHNDSKHNSFEVYGRKKVGAVQLYGDITYLHGKNETEMTVDGTSIKADVKTDTYSVGVRAEVPYKVGRGTVAPFAGLRYIRINGRDYSNNLGMEFSTNNLSSVVLPFGVSYKTAVDDFYGWKMKPEVALGYAFNLGNRDSKTNVTHEKIGSSYAFDVLDKGTFFAKAGISASKKNFTVGVGYDYMKSSNSHNNRWNVNCTWSF